MLVMRYLVEKVLEFRVDGDSRFLLGLMFSFRDFESVLI